MVFSHGVLPFWSASGSVILDAPPARALSVNVELVENGVIHCLPWGAPRSTVDTRNKKGMIALLPCTPPPTLETLRERISLSTRSSMEIAG